MVTIRSEARASNHYQRSTVKKTRPNRYPTQPIPKTIRYPDEFLKAGRHVLETIAQGNGNTVDLKTKGKCNKRYADFWIYFLKRKHLIFDTPGHYRGPKDWAYKKLTPTNSFSHALASCLPRNKAPQLTGDTFVDELNLFYSEQEWLGCAQPVVKRNKDHGRIYSQGPNHYQALQLEQRTKIKVNNIEMVELDISASHLTALIGKTLHVPSNDPYEIDGCYRDDVKGAFKILLGSTAHGKAKAADSWYQDPDYRNGKASYYGNCKTVSAALIRHYPFLTRLQQGTHNTLMQREADVIVRVMKKLMQRNIVSLSMHDGLLVEAGASEVAKKLLEHEYASEFRIKPKIKVKAPEISEASNIEKQEQINIDEITEWILQQVGMSATFSSSRTLIRLSQAPGPGDSNQTHKLEKVAASVPVADHGGSRSGAGRKKQEPWVALGFSKDKYYRLKRKGKL